MAGRSVNGGEIGLRSGAQTLSLLASPLNVHIVRALAKGPLTQTELRRATGSPAQTTLRAQLRKLYEIRAIERNRRDGFPGALDYELTPAGYDLQFVIATLERWLAAAPDGCLELGGNRAKAAINALVQGWSTAMLRTLALRPRSLTELDAVITTLSYPSLERRVSSMRLAGQLEAGPKVDRRGAPYSVTMWSRHAVAPIFAAARWERRYLSGSSAPIGRLDIETALLLALPLLQLPTDILGTCRMAVEIPGKNERKLAGATIRIETGMVRACSTQLGTPADAWTFAPPNAWLDAIIEADVDRLERGGDGRLARAVLDGLRSALFDAPAVSGLT